MYKPVSTSSKTSFVHKSSAQANHLGTHVSLQKNNIVGIGRSVSLARGGKNVLQSLKKFGR